MESESSRPDNGILEKIAKLNQCIAFIKSGRADHAWIERFDAAISKELENGVDETIKDKLWRALLVLREEQIFLDGHTSEQKVEKIERLIGLLQGRNPPAGWLCDFEKIFSEKRRLGEKNEQVQGMLLDLAVAADQRAIGLNPRRQQMGSWGRKSLNEHEHRRSVESGEWNIFPKDQRRILRAVPYPLQDRRAKRSVSIS